MADDPAAFPTLEPDDIEFFAQRGRRRRIAVGEYLYREGDATYDFYVVLSGAIEIYSGSGSDGEMIARHTAGRFLGELNMLTGQRVFVSALVVEAGEVIQVPTATLREVIATHPRLSDLILAAFLGRRAVLLDGASAAIRLVGSRFSPESARVREFLSRSRIPHQWIDPDRDEGVERLLCEFGVKPSELPVVIVAGQVLRHPTPGELAQFLGLTVDSLPTRCFDLVVVGGGPAGLAASVYGASEGLQTLGLEMLVVGGQAGSSSRIENYLGFPTGISGADLTQRAVVQAEKFGAQLTSPCAATGMREEAGHLVVHLSDGTDVAGRTVIAATGARYRRLDADGIEDFESKGVFYAATELEARQCAAAPVVVAGGGNSAGQAAMFLAESGSPVTIVIRGSDLSSKMSRYLVDRIHADDRISVRTDTRITALQGDDEQLRSILIDEDNGNAEEIPCNAVFSFIGADPASQWLSGCAAVDDHGFVLTDRALSAEQLGERWDALGRDPLPFESSHPGLFAVGDLRAGSTKRVAAAVGEGSSAVRSVHEFLAFVH